MDTGEPLVSVGVRPPVSTDAAARVIAHLLVPEEREATSRASATARPPRSTSDRRWDRSGLCLHMRLCYTLLRERFQCSIHFCICCKLNYIFFLAQIQLILCKNLIKLLTIECTVSTNFIQHDNQ